MHSHDGLTTSRRVLFIPELLHIIFTGLDRTANAQNARVCKQWFEIAMDHVWENVENIIQLFRLLKPITRSAFDGKPSFGFISSPEPQDWNRFQKYARRVRCLRFQSVKLSYRATAVLDAIARTRTSLEILPNMHTLEWISDDRPHLERCTVFLHSRLKHLTVSAHLAAYRPTLFKDISARVPSIHSLKLDISRYDNLLETDIRSLLRNLPDLRKLTLPEFFLTAPIIEELSRMKNIGVIGLEHFLWQEGRIPVTPFNPTLAEGAFPALWDLALTARIDHVNVFLSSSFAPVNITSLYINTYDNHTPSEVHAFLVTLSQHCQLLSRLVIKLLHKERFMTSFDPEEQFSYDTIKPLLSFSNLTVFELIHKYPLKVSLEDVNELAHRWPSLESFVLNAEPLFLDRDLFTIDLRALLPFARHCPNLKRLGLYVRATGEEVTVLPAFEVLPFTSLEVLFVGTSLAETRDGVARCLSRLCPPSCKLEAGNTWKEYGTFRYQAFHFDLDICLEERHESWKTISQLLPSLIRFRREETEQSRSLQKEVEDLRIRNGLLADKVGNATSSDSCVVA